MWSIVKSPAIVRYCMCTVALCVILKSLYDWSAMNTKGVTDIWMTEWLHFNRFVFSHVWKVLQMMPTEEIYQRENADGILYDEKCKVRLSEGKLFWPVNDEKQSVNHAISTTGSFQSVFFNTTWQIGRTVDRGGKKHPLHHLWSFPLLLPAFVEANWWFAPPLPIKEISPCASSVVHCQQIHLTFTPRPSQSALPFPHQPPEMRASQLSLASSSSDS